MTGATPAGRPDRPPQAKATSRRGSRPALSVKRPRWRTSLRGLARAPWRHPYGSQARGVGAGARGAAPPLHPCAPRDEPEASRVGRSSCGKTRRGRAACSDRWAASGVNATPPSSAGRPTPFGAVEIDVDRLEQRLFVTLGSVSIFSRRRMKRRSWTCRFPWSLQAQDLVGRGRRILASPARPACRRRRPLVVGVEGLDDAERLRHLHLGLRPAGRGSPRSAWRWPSRRPGGRTYPFVAPSQLLQRPV